jgi:phosphoribosylamine---glycine ligase
MKILVLGSGGREHTFAWKLAQSPLCEKLFVAPGNAGTNFHAENVNLSLNNFASIAHFVIDNQVDIVLVGPEEPLVKGIRNFFAMSEKLKNVAVIGPCKDGARLEGSKDFAKKFMEKNQIPTATSATFTKETLKKGLAYLDSHSLPIVLKADGLAAGKGVIIAEDIRTAKKTLEDMLLNQKFGEASQKVVIEEYLDGIEMSAFVITDGIHYKILPEAKDYKRIGEGNTGLNTGGMGAVSPVPFADKTFMQKVEDKVIKPTMLGLQAEKVDFVGFIFFGLMNVKGEPYVIEYNVRMGDPETEVVFPRIKSDFVEMLDKVAQKKLDEYELEIDEQCATTIMLVSGGYPENYDKGFEIKGLDQSKEVLLFHAGTTQQDNTILTNGGRVIALTSLADSMQEALKQCLQAAESVQFNNKYYRKDIGQDLMEYL